MKRSTSAHVTGKQSLEDQVQAALTWLKTHSTRATLDGMARYSIPSDHAYGVAMKDIKALGKTLGRDHALAIALWDTGVYEARMLASFVGDPEQLTPAQMDRWCRDFDNWAFCDAMSFNLFDRSPHAWAKVTEWSKRRNEFEKRTAFALLWSLTVHDKSAGDDAFIAGLALIEREAGDERNFVKKATNMALRAIGTQSRAQLRCRRGGSAPGELEGCHGEVGGKGCSPRTHESWSGEAPQEVRLGGQGQARGGPPCPPLRARAEC